MSRVDWSSMTAREVWEALKRAPKIAGPWEQAPNTDGGVEVFERRGFDASGIDDPFRQCTRVLAWSCQGETALTGRGDRSVKDRAQADAILRETGWLLADDPEYGVWLQPRPGVMFQAQWLFRWADDWAGLAEPERFTRQKAEEIAASKNAGNVWIAEVRELPPVGSENRADQP